VIAEEMLYSVPTQIGPDSKHMALKHPDKGSTNIYRSFWDGSEACTEAINILQAPIQAPAFHLPFVSS